jgi:hypothetical protein
MGLQNFLVLLLSTGCSLLLAPRDLLDVDPGIPGSADVPSGDEIPGGEDLPDDGEGPGGDDNPGGDAPVGVDPLGEPCLQPPTAWTGERIGADMPLLRGGSDGDTPGHGRTYCVRPPAAATTFTATVTIEDSLQVVLDLYDSDGKLLEQAASRAPIQTFSLTYGFGVAGEYVLVLRGRAPEDEGRVQLVTSISGSAPPTDGGRSGGTTATAQRQESLPCRHIAPEELTKPYSAVLEPGPALSNPLIAGDSRQVPIGSGFGTVFCLDGLLPSDIIYARTSELEGRQGDVDTVLELYVHPSEIAAANDDEEGHRPWSALQYEVGTEGTYRLVVRGYSPDTKGEVQLSLMLHRDQDGDRFPDARYWRAEFGLQDCNDGERGIHPFADDFGGYDHNCDGRDDCGSRYSVNGRYYSVCNGWGDYEQPCYDLGLEAGVIDIETDTYTIFDAMESVRGDSGRLRTGGSCYEQIEEGLAATECFGGESLVCSKHFGIVRRGVARQFADEAVHPQSCEDYRNPPPPYVYRGEVGPGTYLLFDAIGESRYAQCEESWMDP